MFSMCSTADGREQLRTSVITGHCMPEGLEDGAKSVCCQWNSVSLCLATLIPWGTGGLTYGFAILGSCSAVMPRRTGLLDRRRRGSFVVGRKRGLGYGGPDPGRKEKEPKERGSFSSPLVARWNLPDRNSQATDAVSKGEKTKVEEKSPSACRRVWLEGQTAQSTGSRWKLRIELTPSPVRSSVYRTLVGFFGAQSAAGVGLGVGVGVASGRRGATLSPVFLCMAECRSVQVLSIHARAQSRSESDWLGLDRCSVCFLCLAKKRESKSKTSVGLASGKANADTQARTLSQGGQSVLETMVRLGCVVTKKIRGRKKPDGRGLVRSSRVAANGSGQAALLGRPVQFHGKCKLQSPLL